MSQAWADHRSGYQHVQKDLSFIYRVWMPESKLPTWYTEELKADSREGRLEEWITELPILFSSQGFQTKWDLKTFPGSWLQYGTVLKPHRESLILLILLIRLLWISKLHGNNIVRVSCLMWFRCTVASCLHFYGKQKLRIFCLQNGGKAEKLRTMRKCLGTAGSTVQEGKHRVLCCSCVWSSVVLATNSVDLNDVSFEFKNPVTNLSHLHSWTDSRSLK